MRVSEPSFELRCPDCGAVVEKGQTTTPPPSINSPATAVLHLRALRARKTEALVVITLNAQNVVLGKHIVSVGSLNQTNTHPREVLLPLIRDGAAGAVIAHNHPSGSLTATEDDRAFTRRMREALDLVGFALHDHIIVAHGNEGFVSFRQNGWL